MSEASTSESLHECRICGGLDGLNDELIDPCDCQGSVQFVHMSCLQQWISARPAHIRMICEMCHVPYRLKLVTVINPTIPSLFSWTSLRWRHSLYLMCASHVFDLIIVIVSIGFSVFLVYSSFSIVFAMNRSDLNPASQLSYLVFIWILIISAWVFCLFCGAKVKFEANCINLNQIVSRYIMSISEWKIRKIVEEEGVEMKLVTTEASD